ncbi:MAG: hypothetical protein JRF33_25345 [Deltaproteobacteria bacterium]|nr:hypothetical protein [Deltaproteobacteria bacterium]
MSSAEQLQALRGMLMALAGSLELDDPAVGLVARIPVVGGSFLHPVSRESIAQIRVYGAGSDKVKVIEPRFMRSLPLVSISGLLDASQFCGRLAQLLGEKLGRLGQVRDRLTLMGIKMDLEQDVLRLRGQVNIEGLEVELYAGRLDQLCVLALGSQRLAGLIGTGERLLPLSGNSATDLAALGQLIKRLDEQVQQITLADMEASLGLLDEVDAPPLRLDPSPLVPQTKASPEPKPATPPQPLPAEGVPPVVHGEAISAFAAPPMPESSPGFAKGGSDVMELTELVEEVVEPPVASQPAPEPKPAAVSASAGWGSMEEMRGQNTTAPIPTPAPMPAVDVPVEVPASVNLGSDEVFEAGPPRALGQPPKEALSAAQLAPPAQAPDSVPPEPESDSSPSADLSGLRIDYLFEMTGGDTEITAHEGRLRLKIPFKVVQGEYLFYLEQRGPKQFKGFLVSPKGTRTPVDVDFTAVFDIKEVFDKVML